MRRTSDLRSLSVDFEQPEVGLCPTTRLTPVEVSAFEVVETRRVDGPVEAATRRRSAALHEALVHRQVVSHTVPPRRLAALVVREVTDDELVDVVEERTFLWRA